MAPTTRSRAKASETPTSTSVPVPKTKKSSSRVPKPTTASKAKPDPAPSDPNGPIFFWKPQETTTGYLSQWYAQPFRDRKDSSIVYPTAEHYMMYQKALLFGDPEIGAAILEAESPRDVKALGRQVRGFNDATWKRAREGIVTEGNWCKFSLPVVIEKGHVDGEREWKLGNGAAAERMRARSFRDVLLATGTRELVEASPMDKIWGIGFGAKNAEASRQKWGMNLLGKCLMEVREQFWREKEAKEEAEDEVAKP